MINKLKNKLFFKKGFSVTEAAIALTAVAALVIVAVGGADLIRKAQILRIVKEVKVYSEAVVQFENKYNSLPGDIAKSSVLDINNTSSDNGNGNGVIDQKERLLFWKHLAQAKLIDGTYDGINEVPGLGLPKGPLNESGYYIVNITNNNSFAKQSIVIGLSGFSEAISAGSLGVLTPKEAYNIDKKIDDGNPNRGIVRAINGNNQNCITNNDYNLKVTDNSCIVEFVTKLDKKLNDNNLSGICTQAGDKRETPDSSSRCPVGYIGKIMESCKVDLSTSIGSWEISDRLCEKITCPGGKVFGQRRNLGCLNGQTGTGIVEECSQYGVWQEIEDLSNCTTPSGETDGATCITASQSRSPQACSWGRSGLVNQICINGGTGNRNYWQTITNGDSCARFGCGDGSLVGDVRKSSSKTCGQYYQGIDRTADSVFAVTESCTMDGTWQVVSDECSPQYGSCVLGTDTTRDIGCPPGNTGSHKQVCVGTTQGYWITASDNCRPVTCSGEKVGAVRILESSSCESGQTGIIMEVCHDDGTWVATNNNCTKSICIGVGNNDGNANWPNADSGTNNISATSCTTLYRKASYPSGALPTRSCDVNAHWGNVTNQCVRIRCAKEVSDNANFPASNDELTDSGPDNVTGSCVSGYTNSSDGPPTKKCSPNGEIDVSGNGQWTNLTNPCVSNSYSGIPLENLVMWYDASETATMLSNQDCSDDPPGTDVIANPNDLISCWKDKSPLGLKAIAADDNRPAITTSNSMPAMEFGGSNFMTIPSMPDFFSVDGEMWTFIVADVADPNSTVTFFSKANSSSAYSQMGIKLNAGDLTMYGTDTIFSEAYSTSTFINNNNNKPYIFAVHAENLVNGLKEFFINGSLQQSTNSGTDLASSINTPVIIGGKLEDASDRFVGNIYELIAYNADLSGSNVEAVNNYLSNKWGISLIPAPPGDVTIGLNFWLDGSDTDTVFVDTDCTQPAQVGNKIACFKDKALNNIPMTQDIAESRPLVSDATYSGGRKSAEFTSDFLNSSKIIANFDDAKMSVFTVITPQNNPSATSSPSLIVGQMAANTSIKGFTGFFVASKEPTIGKYSAVDGYYVGRNSSSVINDDEPVILSYITRG